VPVIKPLLICVLDGCKKLGKDDEIICSAGDFIFLANSPNIHMRNIPQNSEYFALLIEFGYKNFLIVSLINQLKLSVFGRTAYFIDFMGL
jgi:hypothetical protein